MAAKIGPTNFSLPSGANNPSSGQAEGDLFYNTTTDNIRLYNGTSWDDIILLPFSTVNTSSMAHSEVNTQEQGSSKITTYGDPAWSVQDNVFGAHDGHEGNPADYPAYVAVYLGGTAYAVNRLHLQIHNNCFGWFELQGSNNASTSGTFYNTGNWTSLSFSTSNNNSVQNAGGTSSGLSDNSSLIFEYNNSIKYTHYRLWIKDTSRWNQSVGTSYVGWAAYYWKLYRE